MYIFKHKKVIKTTFLFFVHAIIFSPLLWAKPVYVLEEDYIAYPYTLELGYNFGFTNSMYQLFHPKDKGGGKFEANTQSKGLIVHTVILDIGWTQISRAWYKYMQGYPKIGFDLKYSRFENKGNIVSALLYIAPQADYLSIFEFMPKIGLGVAYLNIPLVYPSLIDISNADGEIEYEEEPQNIMHEVPFRRGIGLEIDLGFNFTIRPHPNWIVTPSLGFVYWPDFNSMVSKDDSEDNSDEDEVYTNRKNWLLNKDTDILLYTFGICVGYTPNPNVIAYTNDELSNDSNVKIAFSYSKKKYDRVVEYAWKKFLTEFFKNSENKARTDTIKGPAYISTDDVGYTRDEVYNVFGLNLQWAIKCTENHGFVFATEFIFDQTNRAVMDALGLVRNSSMKFAFAVGHDFLYENLSIGQQLGFYLLNSVYSIKISSWLREIAYLRLNVDYKIKEHWIVGVAIRNRLEILYDDRDKKHDDVFSFGIKKIYEFGIKMDYPEIYIGYAF